MRIFDNKKIGINVLAVVVAVGSNASCQRKQSAPNGPERLVETPNSDNEKAGLSKEGSNSPQNNVLKIPKSLRYFVSPGSVHPVINSQSLLWGSGKFKDVPGSDTELLVLSLFSVRFLFEKKTDEASVKGFIEATLLKIRRQSDNQDFFMLIVLAGGLPGVGSRYIYLISKTIGNLRDQIYAGRSSLARFAISRVSRFVDFQKVKDKDIFGFEYLTEWSITHRYDDDIFIEFKVWNDELSVVPLKVQDRF